MKKRIEEKSHLIIAMFFVILSFVACNKTKPSNAYSNDDNIAFQIKTESNSGLTRAGNSNSVDPTNPVKNQFKNVQQIAISAFHYPQSTSSSDDRKYFIGKYLIPDPNAVGGHDYLKNSEGKYIYHYCFPNVNAPAPLGPHPGGPGSVPFYQPILLDYDPNINLFTKTTTGIEVPYNKSKQNNKNTVVNEMLSMSFRFPDNLPDNTQYTFKSYLPPYDINIGGITSDQNECYLNRTKESEYDSLHVYNRNRNSIQDGAQINYLAYDPNGSIWHFVDVVTPPFLVATRTLAVAATSGTKDQVFKVHNNANLGSTSTHKSILMQYKNLTSQIVIKCFNTGSKYAFLVWGVKLINIQVMGNFSILPQGSNTELGSSNSIHFDSNRDTPYFLNSLPISDKYSVVHNIPEYRCFEGQSAYWNPQNGTPYSNSTSFHGVGVDPYCVKVINPNTSSDHPVTISSISRDNNEALDWRFSSNLPNGTLQTGSPNYFPQGNVPFDVLPQQLQAWNPSTAGNAGSYIGLLVQIIQINSNGADTQYFPKDRGKFAWIAVPIGTGTGSDTNKWLPGTRYTYMIDLKGGGYVDPFPDSPQLYDPQHYIENTPDAYSGRTPGQKIFTDPIKPSVTVEPYAPGDTYDLDL